MLARALEDRSFQIVMVKGRPKKLRIDLKKAEVLRGKLAYFQKNMKPTEITLPQIYDTRLEEILEPLLAVTPEEYRDQLWEIAEREK